MMDGDWLPKAFLQTESPLASGSGILVFTVLKGNFERITVSFRAYPYCYTILIMQAKCKEMHQHPLKILEFIS